VKCFELVEFGSFAIFAAGRALCGSPSLAAMSVFREPAIQAWMWHADLARCVSVLTAELLRRRVKYLDLHSSFAVGAANCLSSVSIFGPLDAIPSHLSAYPEPSGICRLGSVRRTGLSSPYHAALLFCPVGFRCIPGSLSAAPFRILFLPLPPLRSGPEPFPQTFSDALLF
jgi:hypothetical protein